MAGLLERIANLDRRWIFLVVGLSVAIPIVVPVGLPVTTTASTRSAYEYIESLKPGDIVWISFDYGPSSAPENDPMVEAVMRHCFLRKIRVVVCALYPLGGLGLANSAVAKIHREFPDLVDGVDYVNLGYKDGAAAVMRKLGDNIAEAFPTDVNGRPTNEIPMLRGVRTIRQIALVFTAATGLIGEWWITQVNAQFSTPVVIGPTAVSAAKYYAFLNSGQLTGMLGGLKGAAEYEKLLMEGYPAMAKHYGQVKGFTAAKGMDGVTAFHIMMMAFIVAGNVAFVMVRLRARRGSRGA